MQNETHNDISENFAVISGLTRTLRTRMDGKVLLVLEIDSAYHDSAMHWFGAPRLAVAVARLNPEVMTLSEVVHD